MPLGCRGRNSRIDFLNRLFEPIGFADAEGVGVAVYLEVVFPLEVHSCRLVLAMYAGRGSGFGCGCRAVPRPTKLGWDLRTNVAGLCRQ